MVGSLDEEWIRMEGGEIYKRLWRCFWESVEKRMRKWRKGDKREIG